MSKYNYLSVVVALVLILPTIVWIVLDHGVWRGDPVGYAITALMLHKQWGLGFQAWLGTMFNGYKGPGIYWLGQFMVPFGQLLNNLNFAFLLIPVGALFLSIHYLYKSFVLLHQSKLVAFCGCLILVASPLLNGLVTGFWIEPLQVAIVSWFIYATCKAKDWGVDVTIAKLLIAFSLALLVKASSPLYILGSAATISYVILKQWSTLQVNRKFFFLLFIAFIVVFPTVVFYIYNYEAILRFAHFASTSPLFSSNIPRFDLWQQNVSSQLFQEPSFFLSVVVFFSGIILTLNRKQYNRLTGIFLLSVFQIALFFAAWQSSSNVDSRYFAPALPYFSALVCWALTAINVRLVTIITTCVFLLQFFLITGCSFVSLSPSSSYGNTRPFTVSPDNDMRVIQGVLSLITRDSAVIVDLSPELGVAEIQYELAKNNINGNWQNSCKDIGMFFNYNHQEIDTSTIQIDSVVNAIRSYHPDYYITWDSRRMPDMVKTEMQRIDRYNAVTIPARWAIAEKLAASQEYRIVNFPNQPKVLVFKRIEPRK